MAVSPQLILENVPCTKKTISKACRLIAQNIDPKTEIEIEPGSFVSLEDYITLAKLKAEGHMVEYNKVLETAKKRNLV